MAVQEQKDGGSDNQRGKHPRGKRREEPEVKGSKIQQEDDGAGMPVLRWGC